MEDPPGVQSSVRLTVNGPLLPCIVVRRRIQKLMKKAIRHCVSRPSKIMYVITKNTRVSSVLVINTLMWIT